MRVAVRHNLQVFDPTDESHREVEAFVLPVRDAQAVMGETVAAYLKRVEWRFDLPTVCRINGEFYGRTEWESRALGANDNIEFISRPLTGGSSSGGSGKSIMGVVALIALTVLAPYAVGALGAAGATALGTSAATLTFAGKLAAAAIIGAGALAVSHFLKPKAGGKTNSSDELYSFGFQGNAARPMQPIPVLNGRLRFAPDYAAPTYSEYSGDSMIDYALFALTCGRMRVEELLIGDTPIWHYQNGPSPDYPGIEVQIVEPGDQVTLYPVNVVTAEELQGVELQQTYTPGYIINSPGTLAKELIFDFVWPGGAFVTYKDRMVAATTHVRVEVRQVDAAGAPLTGWTIIVDDPYVQAKDSQIRMTVRRIVEPARYQVRARRMNPSVDDSGVQKISGTDEVTWTAARAHIEGPQSFQRVMTLAVKGVASKQLSGISGGQLRVIGTRILPVWRDGQFVEEPTRSIAWAALDWWRNGDYSAGLSLRDADFQAFVSHDALWQQLGHTFDYRFTEVTTLDDVLETVLKAGRAFPSPVGDKITITRDQPRVLPRMLFTDNDIVAGSFEIDYALSDESWADGLVGEYVDQTTWRLAEVTSAPEGTVLLKPGRVQLQGVVDRKQATGLIRMMAAESQYRRITATWTARMEGRLLKKGDLVHVSTEMPETWGRSHEVVVAEPLARRLTLEPAPEWAESGNHYIEIRQRDGRPWGPVLVERGRNDSEVVVLAGAAAAMEELLDVSLAEAVYRSDTQEPGWVVFSPGQPRSFPILITEGDPDQDGEHITLTGVVDAPEVYATTENGVPPLLQIPDLYSSTLPVILGIVPRINQRQATLVLTVGWPAARNAATYDAAVSYDGGANWSGAYSGDRTTFEANVASSDDMRVRVRGVTPSGQPGGWSVVEVDAPDFVIPGALVDVSTIPPISYEKLGPDAREKIDAGRVAADEAKKAADEAEAVAIRLSDNIRRGLAADPSVRQGFVDGMMGDVQKSVSFLAEVATRLLNEVNLLKSQQAAAGIEVLPELGLVRIAGLARLETEVGTRLTSLSFTVDALQGLIESYGAVQTGDLSGLVTQINTVRQTLNATNATIATLATSAQFDEVSATLGSVQTTLDAQGAEIEQRATKAVVTAQGSRLTTVENGLNAAEGRIRSAVTAAGTGQVDLPMLTRILSQLGDVLMGQIGALSQNVARAETNTSANFDDQGRAVAEVSTRLFAFQGDASAQFATVTRAIAGANEALVQSQTLLLARIGDASAEIAEERTARTAADTAQTIRLDSALVRIGSAEAGITSLGKTVADNQNATASQFQGVSARLGQTETGIQSLAEAASSDREANGRFFTAVDVRFGKNEGSISNLSQSVATESEVNGRFRTAVDTRFGQNETRISTLSEAIVNESEANGQFRTAVDARFGRNEGSIDEERRVRTGVTDALAEAINTIVASTPSGTAAGRIRFEAVSGPAGVAARYSIQLSTERNGVYRNSGLFLDIFDNGSSRVVIDANLFALTSDGGTTYPFTVQDGLTIIRDLRVTQTAILPGSVTSPYSLAVGDTDPGGSSDQWREIPGTGLTLAADTGTWSVVFSGTADVTITAVGTGGVTLSASIEVAIGADGSPYATGSFATASRAAGGGLPPSVTERTGLKYSPAGLEFVAAGQPRRFCLLYRFRADPGSSGRINYAQFKALITKR